MRLLREPRRRLASRRQTPLRHLHHLHSRTATLSQQPLVAQLLLRLFPTTRPGRMPITQSRKMVLLAVILLPMLPKVARFEYCRTETRWISAILLHLRILFCTAAAGRSP